MSYITCIIPARNAQDTIQRAIVSALNAGVDEVLIYDDSSTDKTDEKIEAIRQANPHRVRAFYYGCMRSGVSFARNFLIEEAQDGFIIPLDADDCLHDVTPLVEAYEPNRWVYGNHVEHVGTMSNLRLGAPAQMTSRKNVTGVTFLFTREMWADVGGYDPDFAYLEDWAFQCALMAKGFKGKYIDYTVYDRYMKIEGNERTARAGAYWPFYRDMAVSKYPAIFANNR